MIPILLDAAELYMSNLPVVPILLVQKIPLPYALCQSLQGVPRAQSSSPMKRCFSHSAAHLEDQPRRSLRDPRRDDLRSRIDVVSSEETLLSGVKAFASCWIPNPGNHRRGCGARGYGRYNRAGRSSESTIEVIYSGIVGGVRTKKCV